MLETLGEATEIVASPGVFLVRFWDFSRGEKGGCGVLYLGVEKPRNCPVFLRVFADSSLPFPAFFSIAFVHPHFASRSVEVRA